MMFSLLWPDCAAFGLLHLLGYKEITLHGIEGSDLYFAALLTFYIDLMTVGKLKSNEAVSDSSGVTSVLLRQ